MIVKDKCDRPNGAIARNAFVIVIFNLQSTLGLDRPSNSGQPRFPRRSCRRRADKQSGSVNIVLQFIGQHSPNLRQQTARGAGQWVIGPMRDPSGAKHQRLDLFFGKHQWRQHESWAKYITDASFTLNIGSLGFQAVDISI